MPVFYVANYTQSTGNPFRRELGSMLVEIVQYFQMKFFFEWITIIIIIIIIIIKVKLAAATSTALVYY